MSIETAVSYRRLLLLVVVLVAGMWHLHLRDANKKRCSESSENVIFSSYYAPLLQHGPLPVWHFPSSWGESSQPDNEAQSSDKKVRNAGGPRRERCACFGRRRGGAREKRGGGDLLNEGHVRKKTQFSVSKFYCHMQSKDICFPVQWHSSFAVKKST